MTPGTSPSFAQRERGYYVTDFREYQVSTEISAGDWTERSGGNTYVVTADGSSLSGLTTQTGAAGNDVFSCTWDRLGSSAGSSDFNVLALVKRSSFSGGTPALCGITRTTSDGEGGLGFGFASGIEIEISEYNGGLWVAGTTQSFASSSSTWYWLRLARSGINHTGSVWALGSDESTATTVSRNAGVAGGNIGMFIVNTNGIRFAYFAAAIGSGVAPSPPG